MAIFKSDVQVDFSNSNPIFIQSINFSIVSFSSTKVVVDYIDVQWTVTLTGSGFQLTPNGLDLQPTGTLNGLLVETLGGVSFVLEIKGLNFALSTVPSFAGNPQGVWAVWLSGDDSIVLSNFSDDFLGFSGNDTMVGGLGNDTLDGGAGHDVILGGTGNDFLIGGGGNDGIAGQGGADWIDGGSGNDNITGNASNDTVFGGSGLETILGGDGNDWIAGDGDVDRISGDAGNDTIDGGAGNDSIVG